jgi:predicted nucleotidyltransferase
VKSKSLRAVLEALHRSGARYLVVGGVAVVAHGFVRLTEDLDVVLRLEDSDEVRRALTELSTLDYQPLVPVPLLSFADAAARASWVVEKHAVVFQLYSDRFPSLRIDLFLESPFDFDRAFAEATTITLDAVEFRVAGLEDLIAMKRKSGRPKDLDDIEHLEALRGWGEG